MNRRRSSAWWWPLTLLALGSLVFVRQVGAGGAFEMADSSDDGPKYLCLGSSVAVRLGGELQVVQSTEQLLTTGYFAQKADAQRRCRLEAIPVLGGAQVEGSLTWPNAGFATVVQSGFTDASAALERFGARAEQLGWVETPGSMEVRLRKSSTQGAAHFRAGAWIQTVAVRAPDTEGIWLVTTGQFVPKYF